jgi:hypothetical protein
MKESLIAPCGMNCAVCMSFLARETNLNSKGFNRTYCEGCLPRGKNCLFMAGKCERLGEGRVRFCFECDDFPCKRLRALDKRYRTKYHLSMLANLKENARNGPVPTAEAPSAAITDFASAAESTFFVKTGSTAGANASLALFLPGDRWPEHANPAPSCSFGVGPR